MLLLSSRRAVLRLSAAFFSFLFASSLYRLFRRTHSVYSLCAMYHSVRTASSRFEEKRPKYALVMRAIVNRRQWLIFPASGLALSALPTDLPH